MTRAARARLLTRGLAACIVVVLVFPACAHAEWQFSPFVGYAFNGSTNLLDFGLLNNETANDEPHLNFGGSVRLVGDGVLGVEGYYVQTPKIFESRQFSINLPRIRNSRTYAVMGNAVLTTPRSWNQYGLRPSLSGGVGLIHAAAEDQLRVSPYSFNVWGMNAGGGAVGLLSDKVGVRFDVRYFRNLTSLPEAELVLVTLGRPVRLSYWTASIGIVFSR